MKASLLFFNQITRHSKQKSAEPHPPTSRQKDSNPCATSYSCYTQYFSYTSSSVILVNPVMPMNNGFSHRVNIRTLFCVVIIVVRLVLNKLLIPPFDVLFISFVSTANNPDNIRVINICLLYTYQSPRDCR